MQENELYKSPKNLPLDSNKSHIWAILNLHDILEFIILYKDWISISSFWNELFQMLAIILQRISLSNLL